MEEYMFVSQFVYQACKEKIIMILEEETKIELKPAMAKILCVSSAYHDTFVLVRVDKPCQQESIVHIDSKGNILWEQSYSDVIDFFAMPTEKEVIVLNVPNQTIDLLNLETHHITRVNHQYLFEDTTSMAIFTFPFTKYFCIVEKGGHNDHRLKLAYYSSDNIKEGAQPIAEWSSSGDEWTSEHNVDKLNNHSKVGWWTYREEEDPTFSYFDLEGHPEGKFQVVKIKNTISDLYGVPIRLGISYLWEIGTMKYMLVAISTKFQHKDKCKTKGDHGVYNNNFIVDTTLGNDQATLRETHFVFDVEEDGFMYNDQLINCFGLGNVSVFHTFRHKKGELQETPVYYVNNETEKIIHKATWKSVCHNANFFFPGWDGSAVVQTIHQNGNCQYMTVIRRKALQPKQIYLNFLLHLNEDFDDDLLQDTIDLLT